MARTKTRTDDTATETAETAPAFEFAAPVAVDAELPKHNRPGKEWVPTPFDSTVENAPAGQRYDIAVTGVEMAKEAERLVRRAAAHFKRFARVVLDDRKAPTTLSFTIADEPYRKVTFTSDDIRAWAAESGLPTTGGGKGNAIPQSTRDAFWQAVRDAKENDGADIDESSADETTDE